MSTAWLTFHTDLNDFLPRQRRHQTFSNTFDGRVSIKDMVESLGVPHPEIEALTVNGVSVDFNYLVEEGDRIEAYPVFAALPDIPLVPLRPPLPAEARFVLDTHLGQLASYLRMLGFDTLYRNDYPDEELAFVSSTEERILLTRDLGLLKRSIVTYGYFVRQTNPRQQLAEILRRYNLSGKITPLQRCIRCNGRLAPVAKEAVAERLAPQTRELYHEFSECKACNQLYWKGSHYDRMWEFISGVLEEKDPPPSS